MMPESAALGEIRNADGYFAAKVQAIDMRYNSAGSER
jgi:hypothetical protein